jgi:hypothetical protein
VLNESSFNEWIRVDASPSLDPIATANAFTLAAWVRPSQSSGVIVSRFDAAARPLFALALAANVPVCEVGGQRVFGTVDVPLNRWSHLGITYDGTTCRIFVDGSPQGQRAVAAKLSPQPDPLVIGGLEQLAGTTQAVFGGYGGRLDDVTIHARVLDGDEIPNLASRH